MAEYERTHRDTWERYNAWVQEQGAPPLDDLDFVQVFPDLNLYVSPGVLDYVGARPLDSSWHRLESSVRTTDKAFDLPEQLRERPSGSALVYLSLGSLGSADVDLMRRLVEMLAQNLVSVLVQGEPVDRPPANTVQANDVRACHVRGVLQRKVCSGQQCRNKRLVQESRRHRCIGVERRSPSVERAHQTVTGTTDRSERPDPMCAVGSVLTSSAGRFPSVGLRTTPTLTCRHRGRR